MSAKTRTTVAMVSVIVETETAETVVVAVESETGLAWNLI
jgi:hypothetical protein